MSDLLSRLEARIQKAVEKIEEYQLEIEVLKERNATLEAEKNEWNDKLSSLIERFETLGEATESSEEESEIAASSEETATSEEDHEDETSDIAAGSVTTGHNGVNSYAASPW
jgi:cell division protein ZapB